MSPKYERAVSPPSYRAIRFLIVLLVVGIYAGAIWGSFGHGPAGKLEGPAKDATAWVKDKLGVN